MNRARTLKLIALKHTIELQAYRREAGRLNDELTRLKNRRTQINDLEVGYREHLALPDLRVPEYRDVMQIIGRLRERRDIDDARRDILSVEQVRLSEILAKKQRQIERLEQEAIEVLRTERYALEERLESLNPARR